MAVPVILPVELIDSPVGRPVAVKVSAPVPPAAWICRLAVPLSAVLWLPGLVTVTLPLGSPPTFTAAQAVATWLYSVLPAPYRAVAALSVAVRAAA